MDTDRKGKSPTEVGIKRAANGGFIVTHSYDNYGGGPSYQPPKQHAFSDHKAMMAHVHQHTGGKDTGGNGGSDKLPDQNSGKGSTERGAQVAGQPSRKKGHPVPNQRTRGAGVD